MKEFMEEYGGVIVTCLREIIALGNSEGSLLKVFNSTEERTLLEPKSSASANSATPAKLLSKYNLFIHKLQLFC